MAKVTFTSDVQSISGKLCKKEGVVYSVNKQTGRTTRSDRHEFHDANTEAQQVVRKAFASRAKFGTRWWAENKPSEQNPQGTASYQLVMKAYKSQHKIGNPLSYLRSLVTSDLKVKLGDLDITGSVTAGVEQGGVNKPSGSTGAEGGGSKPSGSTGTEGGGSKPSGGNTDSKPSGSTGTEGGDTGKPSGSEGAGGSGTQGAGSDGDGEG